MADAATGRANRAGSGVRVELDALVRLRFRARGFDFRPGQPVATVLAGRHRARLRGRGLEFDELRAYLPGDDVRAIDWKASQRTRRAHVRVYREERERPVVLIVDQRRAMRFGSIERTKAATAAEVAALVAWRMLDRGDRVGGVVLGDGDQSAVRPDRSERRVTRLLSEIVRFNHALEVETAEEAPGMLNAALARALPALPHDGVVVVVSDFGGADAETARLFTRLAAHNDTVAAFVVDPLERGLPAAGPLAFARHGRQIQVDTSSGDLRERYAARFRERAENARDFLRRREVPVLRIETAGDVATQIRAGLGARRGRR